MAAQITAVDVEGSIIGLVVRMRLRGRDNYVDESGTTLAGDDEFHDWDEDWTFARDTETDESYEDDAHRWMPEGRGHWDFPHKSWNVAKAARV